MIRVLIVDDSAVARFALRRMLASDSEIEVVGEARSGEQALRMVSSLQPDLVLMDITMEGMDGLAATRNLMQTSPRPVIIVSDHVGRRANVGFEALQAGALEVIAKPTARDVEDTEAQRRLQRLIRLGAEVPVVTRRRTLGAGAEAPRHTATLSENGEKASRDSVRQPQARNNHAERNQTLHARVASASDALERSLPRPPTTPPTPPWRNPPSLICIGASTGGPPALATLLAALAPEPHCPIVIVQHITATFTEGLARWLSQNARLQVEVVSGTTTLRAGTVYIAPGDLHLEITMEGRLTTSDGAPESGHRPSVDVLFESVAASPLVSNTLAILLTGMGRDGARGLKAIRDAGGWTIAQDQATSVVYGMPKAAAEIGAAREILPLNTIAERLNAAALRNTRVSQRMASE
jgi:two-component system chemotaxis response regulator CheB